MTDKKKPDNVVFNTDTQKYDAYLKPYATSVSSVVLLLQLQIHLLGKIEAFIK